MNFQINDKVSVLDDAINGTVTAIDGTMITIETDDDFPMRIEAHKLVKIGTGEITIKEIDKGLHIAKSQKTEKKKIVSVSPRTFEEKFLVIDLHIEKLVRKTGGMNNFQILTKQLDTAKYHLELSIRKRHPKIVFIHGVGDGVLREDLHSMLRRYDNVRFGIASPKQYGIGATEVKILQNRNEL